MTDGDRELFARCAGGFEQVLGQELRALRMRRVRPQVGGAIFFGTLADAYRACLWLRAATRVQLVLARVPATDADALHQGVAALPWERHVPPGATIAVDAHGENPNLRNTRFVALKVKDAICDRLRAVRGTRPDVDARNPDLSVNVAVHPKKATVYLNLSGPSLHRRGYRQDGAQTEAPLKETLAASVLLAAGWPDIARAGGCLADPMCGSGTLAIEAAMIAANVAPGLLRARWGFEGWSCHDRALWDEVRGEAQGRRVQAADIRVVAGDADPRAVEIARANARRAGVADLMRLHVGDAADLARHLRFLQARGDAGGLMVANPPYGRRLLSDADLPGVNAALSAAVEALPAGWRVAVITPDTGVDTALGRIPEQVIACHNGPIETWVRLYRTDSAPRLTHEVVSLAGRRQQVSVSEPNSAQFAARLRKVAKERVRWARRAATSCFRVYDADLPDYALSVDLYVGVAASEGDRYAVVREHRRPRSVDAQRAARRFADAVALVSATLDVPAGQVLAHQWQEGGDPSSGRGGRRAAPVPLCVGEGGLTLTIDLAGRPDTGLPLGQRGVRELVGSLAPGTRFANLTATSGAASVYAAAAGAASTVSVDAFPDRVDRVRTIMAANSFSGSRHRFVSVDLRSWLERELRAHHAYDLILCVPPAWMPARAPGEGDWELRRDHVALLGKAARLLAPGGRLVFACERRELRVDVAALEALGLCVEDVSDRTLPHDFERSAAAHRCHVIRWGDRARPRS